MFIFLSHSEVIVSVLESCDLAIKHAFDSREERLQHAEQEIEIATQALQKYEGEFYPE
jgi:hypothetical protein